MCGIAGIIGSSLPSPELESVAIRMRTVLRNRGPDDAGVYVSPTARVAMSHTRLSILDLTEAGHQPMNSADGRYTIVFNGEIYNFRQLRSELEAEGERFQSDSDTEVILALYRKHGSGCVHDLEGMFAFAIWDEQEQSAFLARDPFGIKPLYYSERNGSLVFASEIRAVLASDQVPRKASPQAVFSYWLFGTVQEPLSIVDGVYALSAGHYLTWKDGRMDLRLYWEPQIIGEGISISTAPLRVRNSFQESVQRHLVSDVPVGVFLSGGIDSTAVLASATAISGKSLSTMCISFDDPEFDEGGMAARTARHFGADHHDWRMTAEIGSSLLEEFLEASDQPTIDGFNTYSVSRFAHRLGLKVVLSGLGGDELFGGYGSFRLVPRLVRTCRQVGMLPYVNALLGLCLRGLATTSRFKRLGHFLTDRPSPAVAYWCIRGIFSPDESWKLTQYFLGDQAKHEIVDALRYFVIPRQPTMEDSVCYLELSRYMRNQLLRDSDVMSMSSSLELRLPFVDRKLFEVLRQIPAAIRLAPGKRLLLDAISEIPPWIATSPKRGFVFPFEKWMQAAWADKFQRIGRDSPVTLNTWYQQWCVFALENCLARYSLT